MTKQEFDIMAETWYRRTHRLREVAFCDSETDIRKQKAFKLFAKMFQRMQPLIEVSLKLSQPMPPKYPSADREIIPTP